MKKRYKKVKENILKGKEIFENLELFSKELNERNFITDEVIDKNINNFLSKIDDKNINNFLSKIDDKNCHKSLVEAEAGYIYFNSIRNKVRNSEQIINICKKTKKLVKGCNISIEDGGYEIYYDADLEVIKYKNEIESFENETKEIKQEIAEKLQEPKNAIKELKKKIKERQEQIDIAFHEKGQTRLFSTEFHENIEISYKKLDDRVAVKIPSTESEIPKQKQIEDKRVLSIEYKKNPKEPSDDSKIIDSSYSHLKILQ